MLETESKKYTLRDYIKLNWEISRPWVVVRAMDKVIRGSLPSLQILATASFVNTALAIFNGQKENAAILLPLFSIFLIIFYQYMSEAVINLIKEKKLNRLTETWQPAVIKKIASLDYCHLENHETEELINRVGKNSAMWIWGGFNLLLYTMEMLIHVGLILSVLAFQVWWSALAATLIFIPLFCMAVKAGRSVYETSRAAEKHTRRARYFQEVLTGRENVEERALFSYTKELNRRWYERYKTAYGIHFKAESLRIMKMKSGSLVTVLISAMVVGTLLVPLRAEMVSIGMFIGLATAVFGLVQDMSWELAYIVSELSRYREYMQDFTAFSRLSEAPGALELPAEQIQKPSCIEFKGVSFAYPGTDRLILNQMSFRLEEGKQYAFVGANGAGKTTITKLLTGLYDTYSGEILIDGKNLRDFSPAERKAMFSVVYQDFARYEIPMKDCIGIGNVRGASVKEIGQAIHLVELDNMVDQLPEGLDTALGRTRTDGVDLSGGQWQRIAIARTLVSHAPIHILDEPTAALDPVAESAVYEMYQKISEGKSTIYITHRLGAARLADEILVIADGKVCECGSHESLMEKEGLYAGMYESQKAWYE